MEISLKARKISKNCFTGRVNQWETFDSGNQQKCLPKVFIRSEQTVVISRCK